MHGDSLRIQFGDDSIAPTASAAQMAWGAAYTESYVNCNCVDNL